MAQVSGSLITRDYRDFRGVDFTDREVSLYRSPDSLNMWKDYKNLGKSIETRPEIELVATYDNTIFGLFFYRVGNTEMMIVHSGTKLYRVEGDTKTELFTGMKPARSNAFVYNQILYIKDGINYLRYDGESLTQVTGYIPTTSIGRKPNGGGTVYQDVNMLSAWRKNTFLGDGESTEYYLDAKEIDGEAPIVLVNDNPLTVLTDFDYDMTQGKVTFKVAPPKPLTDGQDNVVITFKKTVEGYADRINKCTLLQVFDNRVFFSGNQDYPNTVWHSSLNDPSYCSDLDFYNEGLDLSPVKSMVAGNNALWVFKEPSQANTTVFYHNPVVDAEYGKIYPSTHSNISTGCVATGINFNDDIAFFSDRGMEAINGDITTEQVVAHRSTMVDSKLLSEANYKDLILEEWEGYLLVIIDNKVYLADSRARVVNQDHNEYEWFYWELEKNITCTKVKDGVLYLGTDEGIYTLGTDKGEYTEVTFTEENGEYVLYGESTQKTTSGKNLIDTDIPNKTLNGLTMTNNGDGSYTIKGTTTKGGFVLPITSLRPTLKANTSYTQSVITVSGSPNGAVIVAAIENSDGAVTYNYFVDNQTKTPSENSMIHSYNTYIAESGITIDWTFKFQLEEGKMATSWEEYTNGASPNQDYPQEIVSTYKAGKYRTTINGREYRFILDEDLRSIGTTRDKVYVENGVCLEKNITNIASYENETITTEYMSTTGGLNTGSEINYVSGKKTREINYLVSPISYWTTTEDEFNYPQYQKTTNKRGCVIDMEGKEVTVSTKIDNGEFETIDTYENVKGYVVSRIKKKKWKSIQLKFSSNKPFSLYSSTLEAYVGGYVKR